MNGHKMPSADEDKYKAMLKEQEDQLATLRHHCEEMQAYSKSQEGQIAELNNTVQTLRDQNALLKAHKGQWCSQTQLLASFCSHRQHFSVCPTQCL